MTPKRMWRTDAAILMLSGMLLALPVSGTAQTETKRDGQDVQVQKETKTKESKAKKKTKRDAEEEATLSFPPVLMDNSRDPASLDLYYGIGGKEDAPNPHDTYRFLDEDLHQTQPKFDVRDAEGRRWRIKLGIEPQAETAATRLVWAAGYYVDEDYYLDDMPVEDLPTLRRGERYVDGQTVRGARLRLESKNKDIGYWKWTRNPFSGTRELNGLRVMMALLNNWDLVTRNNKIYAVHGQRRFVVSDLGASFGRSGNEVTRRKDDLEAYEHSPFIDKMTADTVTFGFHTTPLPFMFLGLGALHGMPDYYFQMVHAQRVVENVPRADARWIGQRLSQLSDDQIRDCFRAAGYSPQEVEGFTDIVRERIAELAAL